MNALRKMRIPGLGFAVLAAFVGQLHAQSTELPPVTVQPPGPPRLGSHGDGKEGKDSAKGSGVDGPSLDRLNKQLRRKVDETHPFEGAAPLDARSPDTKTGVINIPGVQQQYGQNFGRSAFPYRPPPPVYSTPLGPRR